MSNLSFPSINYSGIFLALVILSFIGFCTANGFRLFVLASGSMEPALPPGSLILTQPQQRYLPGQVITFYRSPNQHNNVQSKTNKPLIVTHRVASAQKSSGGYVYLTKGDANREIDPEKVNQRDIIGKVILNLPMLGFLLIWPHSKIGFYFLVLLPALLIIGYLFYQIISSILPK